MRRRSFARVVDGDSRFATRAGVRRVARARPAPTKQNKNSARYPYEIDPDAFASFGVAIQALLLTLESMLRLRDRGEEEGKLGKKRLGCVPSSRLRHLDQREPRTRGVLGRGRGIVMGEHLERYNIIPPDAP